MALDPRFICSGDIESFFVDKLTGLPLAAGVINFYVDGTNTPKSVYKLTGSPGSFAFVSLGTSITLNSVGQYSDGTNSIVIYYFPYHCSVDGDPSTSNGVLELYSSAVFNSGLTQQFTREAWPPLASNLAPSGSSSSAVLNYNYIPNGQFLSHNNHIITDPVNTSPNTISEIAQGGWSFKQTAGGTGTYTISFVAESLNNFPTGLSDAPPYSVLITGTSGTETVRDLTIQWPNVNTFSNSASGSNNVYNLLIAGYSLSGTTQTFNVYLISNFGAGGSTEVDTLIGTITLAATATYTYFNLAVTFPDNSAFISGAGNFVAIAIRMPAGPVNAKFTDFALTVGTVTRTSYPVQTPAQSLSEGVAGWMPTPDPAGMDLYLPLILTQKGMTFDQTIVGQIIAKTEALPSGNELFMDGSTFVASAYSSIGIPYQRLMNYLLVNSPSGSIGGTVQWGSSVIPMYGTGANFVTLYNVTAALTTEFIIQINTPSSGGSATGSGAISIAATSANIYYTATVASVPTASYHWSFVDGSANLTYNVWYSVDGAGTAPATPTGANIHVSLTSSDTIATTIAKTLAAVNQYQFALLNLEGYFLRANGGIDPDQSTRTISGITFNGSNFAGANLGSSQVSAFTQHVHAPATGTAFVNQTGSGSAFSGGGNFNTNPDTGNATANATTETRPSNIGVNYFIKY